MSNLEAEVENSDTEIETHYFCFHDKNRRNTKTPFWIAIFHDKCTLWHIKLTIYIKENKLTSCKQYLYGLLFSGSNLQKHLGKKQLQKMFSPVCMLLLQVSSINVFYSIC